MALTRIHGFLLTVLNHATIFWIYICPNISILIRESAHIYFTMKRESASSVSCHPIDLLVSLHYR